MDWGFCGIIDIIFILLLILTMVLGFKKGFLRKAIGLIGLFVGLVVAAVFCTQLAGCFKANGVIYPGIYDSIEKRAFEALTSNFNGGTVKEVLMNMGIAEFFADMFARSIGDVSILQVTSSIATFFSDILMNIICFFILFFGVFIVSILLKILALILRGSKTIRFIDGLLGVVLYTCLFMLLVYVIFTVFKYMENASFFTPVKEFLDVDMKLKDPDAFRLSKFFYEHNLVYSILHIFF